MATIKVVRVGSDLAPKSNRFSFVGRVTAACWHPAAPLTTPAGFGARADEVATSMGIFDVGKSEQSSGRQREDEQVLTEVVGVLYA